MKVILAFLILAFTVAPANASPRWLKRTEQIIIYVAPMATSAWASHEVLQCRHRTDVANCAGGYGPVYAREYGLRLGFSTLASGLSMFGHKEKFREWIAPSLVDSGLNSIVAIQQSQVRGKNETRTAASKI